MSRPPFSRVSRLPLPPALLHRDGRDGVPLTLSYLRVGIVGAGYTLNLRERELENILETHREEEETTVLRSQPVQGEAAEHTGAA